jgi:hypothetical protein
LFLKLVWFWINSINQDFFQLFCEQLDITSLFYYVVFYLNKLLLQIGNLTYSGVRWMFKIMDNHVKKSFVLFNLVFEQRYELLYFWVAYLDLIKSVKGILAVTSWRIHVENIFLFRKKAYRWIFCYWLGHWIRIFVRKINSKRGLQLEFPWLRLIHFV